MHIKLSILFLLNSMICEFSDPILLYTIITNDERKKKNAKQGKKNQKKNYKTFQFFRVLLKLQSKTEDTNLKIVQKKKTTLPLSHI